MSVVPLLLASFVLSSPAPALDELPRRGALGVGLAPISAELRTKFNVPTGQGLAAQKPTAGLTAEKLGVKEGDILLSINGKPFPQTGVSQWIRDFPANQKMDLAILREGKPMTLSGNLMERPRDPGNGNYTVSYSHVVSNGQRMRTIITRPTKPGKHPAVFFIQGFSPVSYDFTLATTTGDVTSLVGPILFDFANSNYVTLRVEKPGVGDSEGGPFADLDYTTELDIYRQALKQLKADGAVDASNVFIFGHSMGGAFGPMVAAENPVKGLCVYGVAARTWHEYLIESIRHQGLLGGDSPENVDEEVRKSSQLISLMFFENKPVEEIKKSHPHLAQLADGMFPGGYFNGKTSKFWAQLAEINFPRYWAKTNAHVLAIKGASDFVVFESCHKLIADTMNRAKPGTGKWMVLPNSDHLFHNWATEQEGIRGYSQGKFNGAFSKVMKDWMVEVMAKP